MRRRQPNGTLAAPSAAATGVFLSYRREDSAGHAGRLYDALSGRFGADNVFMDVTAIEPGLDFAQVVITTIASSGVFIAMIGRTWLSCADAAGRQRLARPQDFVRAEIRAALGEPED